jgi:hypothetical protein
MKCTTVKNRLASYNTALITTVKKLQNNDLFLDRNLQV